MERSHVTTSYKMSTETSNKKKNSEKKEKNKWDIFQDRRKESRVTEHHTFWKKVNYVTRFFFVVFVIIGVISTAVLSKGAFVILSWNLLTPFKKYSANKLKTIDGHLKYSTNDTRLSDVESGTDVSYIWALFAMVVTPYCLKVLFYGLRLIFKTQKCSEDICWKLVWAHVLITSTIHSVCLSIFAFSLMPSLDPFSGVLFTSSVICFQYHLLFIKSDEEKVNRVTPAEKGCSSLDSDEEQRMKKEKEREGEEQRKKKEREREELHTERQLKKVELMLRRARNKIEKGKRKRRRGAKKRKRKKKEKAGNKERKRKKKGKVLQMLLLQTVMMMMMIMVMIIMMVMMMMQLLLMMMAIFGEEHKIEKEKEREGEEQKIEKEKEREDDEQRKKKAKEWEAKMILVTSIIGHILFIFSLVIWTTLVGITHAPATTLCQKAFFFSCSISDVLKLFNENQKDNTENESNGNNKNQKGNTENKSNGINKTSFRGRLKKDIYEHRYYIYLAENILKLIVTFGMVLVIFGAGCEDGGLCIRVLLGIEKQATARLTYGLGSTLLYHGSDCTRATPFYVAIVGICSSFICHRLCVAGIQIVEHLICFYIPILISPAFAYGIGMLITRFALEDATSCTFPFPSWDGEVHEMWGSIQASGLTGYIALLLTTSFLWKNKMKKMTTEDKIFFKPMYCGALFESSVLFSRWYNVEKSGGSTQKDEKKETVIYMCATMWHETEKEMEQLLKSIFRMDMNQLVRRATHKMEANFEAHVFFDDAFQADSSSPGDYVTTFVKEIERTARRFYRNERLLLDCKTIETPYGLQYIYEMVGRNRLFIHLKDKTKIRNKKRWSQVMYMYYLLSFRLLEDNLTDVKAKEAAKNTFILSLDGDVDFQPNAVYLLLDRMNMNAEVGAACGRIHPKGDGPMVWYQKFEYAISHWLTKSTEHVTGCVLCSPGCFSLFRGSALMGDNVLKRYTTVASDARHHIQYDQGEDRWLCTLLLKQGFKIDYCAASDAYTFAPKGMDRASNVIMFPMVNYIMTSGFTEFYKQRRRWTPSTMLNIMEILADWKEITHENKCVSRLYVMLQLLWFISSVLTPAALLLMISGSINLAYPAMSLHASFLINLGVIVVFVIVCFFAKDEVQLNFAVALSVLYALVMMLVFVGLIRQSVEQGLCSLTPVFTLFVAGIFIVAAICHPSEMGCLFYGPLFFIAIPSMSMLMMFYSIINMNVVSWGTRESIGKTDKEENNAKYGLLERIKTSWNCCTGNKVIPERDTVVIDMLEAISTRINTLEETLHKRENESRLITVEDLDELDKEDEKENEPDYSRPSSSENTKPDKQPNGKEEAFWKWLICEYLEPLDKLTKGTDQDGQAKIEQNEHDIKVELRKYRNSICLAFLLSNAMFVTVIFFLQIANYETDGRISIQLPCTVGKHITVEPIGMAFTLVFGILLVIQFVCMLVHRWKTLLQIYSSPDTLVEKLTAILMESCEEYYENAENLSGSESNILSGPIKAIKKQVEEEIEKRNQKQKSTDKKQTQQTTTPTIKKLKVLMREMKKMNGKLLKELQKMVEEILKKDTGSQNQHDEKTEFCSNTGTAGDDSPKPNTSSEGDDTPKPNTGTEGDDSPKPNTGTEGDDSPKPNTGTEGDESPNPNTGTEADDSPKPNTGTKGDDSPKPNTGTAGEDSPKPNTGTEVDCTPKQNTVTVRTDVPSPSTDGLTIDIRRPDSTKAIFKSGMANVDIN